MTKMDQANIRHLPVVSGDRLLSMLSIRDLMRVAIEERGAEIEYVKEYLYQVVPRAEFEKAYRDRQAAPVGMAVLT